MSSSEDNKVVSEKDIDRLRSFIKVHFGYDFSNYATASLTRRITRFLEQQNLKDVSQLITTLRNNPQLFSNTLKNISVNVTEMFRDPCLWLTLREEIFPKILNKKNSLKIWHCGCSSAEEVYSTKILLQELSPNTVHHITATDFDQNILDTAKKAKYPIKQLQYYKQNYIDAGGKDFEQHFDITQTFFSPKTHIRSNIEFQWHDVVLSSPISTSFDIVFCRNLLIYFNQNLQNAVLGKLQQSLSKKGLLIIGSNESLSWCYNATKFSPLTNKQKIFIKK